MAALRPATRVVARVRAHHQPQAFFAAARSMMTPQKRFESSSPSSPSPSQPQDAHRDLDVGELQGAKFKIEPLRRVGEDPETMRARLLCKSHVFCLISFL